MSATSTPEGPSWKPWPDGAGIWVGVSVNPGAGPFALRINAATADGLVKSNRDGGSVKFPRSAYDGVTWFGPVAEP